MWYGRLDRRGAVGMACLNSLPRPIDAAERDAVPGAIEAGQHPVERSVR
jgi:hypothetical protein